MFEPRAICGPLTSEEACSSDQSLTIAIQPVCPLGWNDNSVER